MLRTNSRAAAENVQKYIVNHFDCCNYEPETIPETFTEIASFVYNCFVSEKWSFLEDYRYYRNNEQAAFFDWCAGLPSVLDTCYFYNRSAVEDLAVILEETETEKKQIFRSGCREAFNLFDLSRNKKRCKIMIKLQAQRSKNASGSLQLIIDTENKTYEKGYFLASFDVVTIGTKSALNAIVEQLKNDGFKEA